MKKETQGEQLLLRIEEVGQLLSLGTTKIRELVASGELRSIHVGRAVRIPRRALDQWLDAQSPRGTQRYDPLE